MNKIPCVTQVSTGYTEDVAPAIHEIFGSLSKDSYQIFDFMVISNNAGREEKYQIRDESGRERHIIVVCGGGTIEINRAGGDTTKRPLTIEDELTIPPDTTCRLVISHGTVIFIYTVSQEYYSNINFMIR